MRERQRLASGIETVQTLEQELADGRELYELAEGDADMLADIQASLEKAAARAAKAELEALLSGEADANDAYLQINAGEGGTESQDWASMLRRMYVRWAEKRGYKVEEMDEREGEEAGIKSATVQIKGENAYGWLKSEQGVAPSGADFSFRQFCAPPYQLCFDLGFPGRRRQYRDRDQSVRCAHRHLSGLGRGRPAHQQDRFRGAFDP